MTVQHIVLFSFPDEPTAELVDQMRAQITGWVDDIPGFRALRFGEDITKARTNGYQFLLYTEFDSDADLHAYQAHAVHQQFLAWVIAHEITPLAFDYHLTQETVLLPREHAPLRTE